MFFVPILDPLPPAYFLRVMSDRWLHSSSTLPISFSSMILPAKFPPSTELLDLQPLLPSALVEPALMRVFSGFKEFNPIQTQAFHELFKTNNSCLICAPSGSGKSVCATFAVLRMIASSPDGKCVYIAPTDEIADHMYATWIDLLGSILQKSSIARLTGETPSDLELLSACMVVVATVRQWDMVSRRWRQRKAVQMVSLYIFDDIHFLGGEEGPVLEIVISRARYVSSQLQQSKTNKIIRIVGMSVPLANARDVAEWMGVSTNSTFNFSPKARPFPLELYFTTFEQGDFSARLLAMAKPVYGTLERHLGSKNAIVYVPSRRQAQLTAIDIMTYSESQGSTLFPEMETDVDKDVIDGLQEPSLRQLVRFGLGYIHNGMIDADWNTIIDLYRRNLIKVLVCPTDVCWRVHCTGHLVIIMGTEYFDGREGRHVDYPVASLVHMIGRQDPQSSGKCVIMCHHSKKDYLKKLTNDPLPIESHLDSYLHDPLNSEIVTKTVGSMQDAIDYVTWTFLYRRLLKNPTYYGLQGTSSVHLSEHLSEMVEAVVGDLEESKCCSVSEEGAVLALNLGMIAAYYYVQYRTIELIASSVTPKTKIRGMLEILSASWEFSSIPIRFGEDKTMKMLARTLVHKIPDDSSFDSNTKALILLQCYFSRKQLPAELRSDQLFVVKESVNLVQAIVDVISSNGWLKPALATMELSQMLVQSMWNKDNVLKQVPHFTDEIITRCLAHSEPVESVFDILALDDEIRNQLLLLPSEKMADVAIFCNNYPSIEVSFQVQNAEDISSGDVVQIAVTLEREDGDEMDDDISKIGSVCAPLFPAEKKEGWWLVIGDLQTNTLYSLKRVNLRQKQNLVLEFLAPDEAGDYDLTLFCMSDSYLGCDQEYSVPLSVAAALVDEEDTDD